MFRLALTGLCRIAATRQPLNSAIASTTKALVSAVTQHRLLSFATQNHLKSSIITPLCTPSFHPAILSNPQHLPQLQQCRTVTKFSLKKGKRKTVKAVLRRFKRLDWGGWIRTRCGRHKKMWKKSSSLKRRLRQHVLVNAQQAWLLDKMVTKYWRQPKYYVDDPYRPYHSREEFPATRKRPIDYA